MSAALAAHVGSHICHEKVAGIIGLNIVCYEAQLCLSFFPHLFRQLYRAKQCACRSVQLYKLRRASGPTIAHVHFAADHGHASCVALNTARINFISTMQHGRIKIKVGKLLTGCRRSIGSRVFVGLCCCSNTTQATYGQTK